MEIKTLRKDILKGSFWTIIGQLSSLLITLTSNIWLARILTPKEFGQFGVLMFFISISNVLTEGGLSGALIRKPNVTKDDYSTIFIFNLSLSCCLFILLYLLSNSITSFYDDETLREPFIVLCSILIINAFQIVHNTRLIAEMKYKRKSLYDFFSTLISSTIGIILAYRGLGLWSLIIMQLSRSVIKTLLLWMMENFNFKLRFSKSSFKELSGFGINTTFTSIINIGFENIYQLIIGKTFSISQVGYFYQSKKMTDVSNGVFASISQGPVFAGLAKIQESKMHFLSSYKKIISVLVSILGLITVILFYYSDIIVKLVLGMKWIESGIFLKYLSISSLFIILEYFNRIIFKVYNKTSKLLQLEIVKKSIQLITIFIGIYYKDIDLLLIGFIISNFIGYLLNLYFSEKILGSGRMEHFILIIKLLFTILLVLGFLYAFKSFLIYPSSFFSLILIIILYTFFLQIFKIFDFKILKSFKYSKSKRLIK